MSFDTVYPAEKMGPERLSNFFKVTQLVGSMIELSTPKLMVFLAIMNHFLLQLPGDER